MSSNYPKAAFAGRPTRRTIILMAGASIILTLLFVAHRHSDSYHLQPYFLPGREKCSAEAYAAGSWKPANKFSPGTKMKEKTDAIAFAGFEGCAADREFFWHLGADHPEQWESRYPMAFDYDWSPADDCKIRAFNREALVADLVQKGGWLLIGDSVTENHFFSLSCLLYPHVRATPNYTENPYYERHWQQDLFLLPTSPLIPKLKFPKGFSIENTPLVTFRRVDLLLSRTELEGLYSSIYTPRANFSLFSNERFWSLSPYEYVRQFTSEGNNYQTMIINTAGHWTTSVFQGMKDSEDKGGGVGSILYFFQHATAMWADLVQKLLKESGRDDRQVIVRPYHSGHENCFNIFEPYTYIHEYTNQWYNWNWITEYNDIFQWLLNSRLYPNIHFLPIDRPGMLRPDAHVAGDCLHLMAGTGVLEGWSHYIWHYITREL